MAAEGVGGLGEGLVTEGFLAQKPSDLAVETGVGEEGREVEAVDGGRGKAGDEFAADAVARVGAGFHEGNGNVFAAQGESERKTGEAAADDFDRTVHGSRRSAISA